MELAQYVQLVRRWWWLMVVVGIVVGGLVFVWGEAQPDAYRAQVRVFIGGFSQDPNPGSGGDPNRCYACQYLCQLGYGAANPASNYRSPGP
ncbi:MAG: hypothetical protein HC915_06415 [Anaerolineae bacterium]|nr:hypothetical protein [Anaerolineae bacterium]